MEVIRISAKWIATLILMSCRADSTQQQLTYPDQPDTLAQTKNLHLANPNQNQRQIATNTGSADSVSPVSDPLWLKPNEHQFRLDFGPVDSSIAPHSYLISPETYGAFSWIGGDRDAGDSDGSNPLYRDWVSGYGHQKLAIQVPRATGKLIWSLVTAIKPLTI